MNRKDICKDLSERLNITQIKANEFIDALKDIVIENCSNDEKVSINGFVSFEKVHRDSRMVINPGTGEQVMSKEKNVLKAKISKSIEL